MAASDNKRYFWFKCDHEFFNGTKMKRLGKSKAFDLDRLTDEEKRQVCALAMQAVYIRLLAESCTHDGELLYDAENPYDDDGVSEVLDCPTSVYRATKDRLIDLKLMECCESGQLNFLELANFIGSETGIARRMRLWRNGDQVTDGLQSGYSRVTSGLQCNPHGLQAGYNVTDQGYKSVTTYPRDKRLEIRDKNNKQGDIKSLSPLPPAGGCCGENGDEVCRFPLDKIITVCLQAHLFATRADAETFGKYVFDNALLESCERNGSPVGLIKSIHNRWKSEGLDRTDLHRVTEEELANAAHRGDRIGLYCCPHTGVALGALEKLVAAGKIQKDENVVVISTAHGLKFTEFKVGYHEKKLENICSQFANPVFKAPAEIGAVMDILKKEMVARRR